MSSFITVSRKDAQFLPLLTGQFSQTHLAQPIKTLYANSSQEQVTFKIIEKKALSPGKALLKWYSLARNIYLLFPIFGGVAFLVSQKGYVAWDVLLLSVLSLQMFLMFVTLFNDYNDYLQGFDRINENNSQKPLIKGWIRPYQAYRWAFVFLSLSFLLSIYCFVFNPQSFIFAVIALALAFLMALPIVHKKYKALSSFFCFLLAGPLLLLGYEFLLFSSLSGASVILGFIFGLHALKYDFSKQMQNIFYSSKTHLLTISTALGFEKSKWLYVLLSICHISLLYLFIQQMEQNSLAILLIVALIFEVYINRLMLQSSSFLSSNFEWSLRLQKLHYTVENSLLIFLFFYPLWSF